MTMEEIVPDSGMVLVLSRIFQMQYCAIHNEARMLECAWFPTTHCYYCNLSLAIQCNDECVILEHN